MYAKLIDNVLHRAPKKLTINDVVIYNPPDNLLEEQGYKPVELVNMPNDAPDGKHYESEWVEQDNAIVQNWYLVDDPEDIPDDEALSIILGGAI